MSDETKTREAGVQVSRHDWMPVSHMTNGPITVKIEVDGEDARITIEGKFYRLAEGRHDTRPSPLEYATSLAASPVGVDNDLPF